MNAPDGEADLPLRIVLADANVLYSRVLRDYLLYAATVEVIEIRWSSAILEEATEHLTRNIAGFDLHAGDRLRAAMNHAFPEAEVEPDAEIARVITRLGLPDENDCHVLAAAVAVAADVLCTDNLRDFPPEAMDEVGIQLMSADALLSLLIIEFPEQMHAAHRLSVSRLSGATDRSTVAALRRAGAGRAAGLLAELLNVRV